MSRRQTLSITEVKALLNERKLELENLQRLSALSAKLPESLLQLTKEIDTIGDGTASSIASVTENWVQIVRAVGLAANSSTNYSDKDYEEAEKEEKLLVTERLVRCRVKNGAVVNETQD
ncbi:hypothetical protein DAMA08_029340 [Martiniozyma asiatica (nom. inval.)]|nr:hypothetical protein DAMA08_029340 [Martiniozyma asiatica]